MTAKTPAERARKSRALKKIRAKKKGLVLANCQVYVKKTNRPKVQKIMRESVKDYIEDP